jgi:uncharacterized protein YdhG (YjbR/CyaY superfamily)
LKRADTFRTHLRNARRTATVARRFLAIGEKAVPIRQGFGRTRAVSVAAEAVGPESLLGNASGTFQSSSMATFDEYLATVPDPQKAELERLRQVVRRAVPDVEEAVSYGVPAFKYKKRPLLGFRASKNHLSVFPFSPEAIDAARDALAGFDLSKGTVRFTPDRPIADAALEQLLRHRLSEIEGGSAERRCLELRRRPDALRDLLPPDAAPAQLLTASDLAAPGRHRSCRASSKAGERARYKRCPLRLSSNTSASLTPSSSACSSARRNPAEQIGEFRVIVANGNQSVDGESGSILFPR